MTVHEFCKSPSVMNHYLSQLRNVEVQGDAMRFRRNLERIGEIMAYEISRHLAYEQMSVQTPLGHKSCELLKDEIVLCSVLRAGLPLHQGLLNYFDWVQNSFISAYRSHQTETEFEIVVEYLASPSLQGKILILADPMLATGRSLQATFKALQQLGTPKEIHIVAAIGASEGVAHVAEVFPKDTRLWIGDIDETLNTHGYIVPGLGDAGDLAYGSKLQH